jgi:hypothetical protein
MEIFIPGWSYQPEQKRVASGSLIPILLLFFFTILCIFISHQNHMDQHHKIERWTSQIHTYITNPPDIHIYITNPHIIDTTISQKKIKQILKKNSHCWGGHRHRPPSPAPPPTAACSRPSHRIQRRGGHRRFLQPPPDAHRPPPPLAAATARCRPPPPPSRAAAARCSLPPPPARHRHRCLPLPPSDREVGGSRSREERWEGRRDREGSGGVRDLEL